MEVQPQNLRPFHHLRQCQYPDSFLETKQCDKCKRGSYEIFPCIYLPLALLLLIAGWPSIALAHVGVGRAESFASGLPHPISGLDHLCAMIGVGIWASQRGGKAIWLFPLAFIIVMAVGGLFGAAAIAIPFVERGIVASVLVSGILIAAAVRMPLALSVMIFGAFAFFHGHAHGSEMPLTASGFAYAAGFLATTILLLSVGGTVGLPARKSMLTWPFRYCGAALILLGLYFLML